MTGIKPSDFLGLEAQYGPDSPLARQEWEQARKDRAQLVNDIATRLGLQNLLGSSQAADAAAIAHEMTGTNEDGTLTKYQQSLVPPDQHELNQLLGAAQHYGILNADKIPPEQLRSIIEARRLGAQQSATGDYMADPFGPTDRKGAQVNRQIAMMGLGTINEMIGLAQSMPFVGDAIGRLSAVRWADQTTNQALEAIRANTPTEDASGLRYAQTTGAMVGYVLPFEGVFRALGLAGKLPFIYSAGKNLGPLTRTFVKGALSADILEGGKDQSLHDLAVRSAFGGGGAAAGEALFKNLLPKLFEKIRGNFRAVSDSYYGYGGEGPLPPAGEAEAEWWFAGEQPSTGTSVVPYQDPFASNPVRLGAGGPPLLGEAAAGPTALNPGFYEMGPVGLPSGQYPMPPAGGGRIALPAFSPQSEARDLAVRAQQIDPLTQFGDRSALINALPNNNNTISNNWVVFNGEQFRDIIKSLGRDAGDRTLSNFGVALSRAAQELGIPPRIFRYATDEFAAIVPREQAQQFADKATEYSAQAVNGVNVKLQPIVAPTFDDAYSKLLTSKSFVDEEAYWQDVQTFAKLRTNQDLLDPPIEPHRFLWRLFSAAESGNLDAQLLAGNQSEVNSWMTSNPSVIYKEYADKANPADAINNYMQAERAARRTLGDMFPENAALEVRQRLAFDRSVAEAYLERALSRVPGAKSTIQLNVQRASDEAATLTKHATLMEAGDIGELAQKPELTNLDVADAAMLKNGGGQVVVKNVGDPAALIMNLIHNRVRGAAPRTENFRFVKRGDSTDLIVTDKDPITDKMVNQYEKYGFFENQRATVNGRPVIIMQPGEVKSAVLDVKRRLVYVNTADVQPGIGTELPPPRDASSTYDSFKAFVTDEMNKGFQQMGIAQPANPWMSDEAAEQMPALMEQFFAKTHIVSPSEQRALESYFQARRVQELAELPYDIGYELSTEDIRKELNTATNALPPEPVTVADFAASRGLTYIPDSQGIGGIISDELSELRVPVASDDAAREFIRGFNREMPDLGPASGFPDELLDQAGPHASNPGNPNDPVWQGGHEQYHASAVRELKRMIRAVDDFFGDESGAAGPAPGVAPPGGIVPPGSPPPAGAAAGAPGSPGVPRRSRSLSQAFDQAIKNRPQDVGFVLQQLDSINLRMIEPFRRAALDLEQRLYEIGIPEGQMWKQYENVSRAMDLKHNAEHPWLREATEIAADFRSLYKRNGVAMRAVLVENPTQRMAYMISNKFSDKEMDAVDNMRNFYERLASNIAGRQNVDPADARDLFRYLRQVGVNQGAGINDPFKDNGSHLAGSLGYLPDFLKAHNFQFRQIDVRTLTTQMIRGAMWQRHVEGPWQAMRQAWEVDKFNSPIPARLREEIGAWLDTVKYGHNPGWDMTIQGVRQILNKLHVPVTNSEVSRAWNWAFGNFYRAKLGGDPAVLFRDSISPLLAGVRIGMKPVAEAYARFFTNPTERAAMFQRGLEGGWLQEGAVKVPMAEIFEAPVTDNSGVSLLSPGLQKFREQIATVGDYVHDSLPKALRQPIQGTALDPLLPYTKLNEVNRVIAGDAGWANATKALDSYQRDLIAAGPSANVRQLVGKLLWDSGVDTFPPPVQRAFLELVSQGNYKQAANLMGNEVANSQGRYGTRESSISIRKAGNTGRMGMTFGSFTQQYVSWMRESFGSHVPWAKKFAMASRYSAVTGLLGLAGAYTGWNFGKWMWHQSLSFAGGPWAQQLYQGFQNVTGRIAEATGQPLSPQQSDAVARSKATTVGDDIASGFASLFPYQRALGTVGDLYSSTRGLNPVEATTRRLVTGERGLGPDFQQVLQLPVINPDDLEAAIAGQNEARAKFSPRDLQVVDQLRHVPREQRWRAWASYRDATRMQEVFPPQGSLPQQQYVPRPDSGGAGNRQ